MIRVYESNRIFSIIDGQKIEDTDYWSYNCKRLNSMDEYLKEVKNHRLIISYAEVSEGLFSIKATGYGDYYYISEDPEKIYKQIKKDYRQIKKDRIDQL